MVRVKPQGRPGASYKPLGVDLSRFAMPARVLVQGKDWGAICDANRNGLVSMKIDSSGTTVVVSLTKKGTERLIMEAQNG